MTTLDEDDLREIRAIVESRSREHGRPIPLDTRDRLPGGSEAARRGWVIEPIESRRRGILWAIKTVNNVLLFIIALTQVPDAINDFRIHYLPRIEAVARVVDGLTAYRYWGDYDEDPKRDDYFKVSIVPAGEGRLPSPAGPGDPGRRDWFIAASGLPPTITGSIL